MHGRNVMLYLPSSFFVLPLLFLASTIISDSTIIVVVLLLLFFFAFFVIFLPDHGWDLVLKSLFPDETDLDRADVLDFGVGHDHLMNILLRDHGGMAIPDKGIRSLTMVMHAVRDCLGIEFCPLLPDVTCLLLSCMPVSPFLAHPSIRVHHSVA